MFVRSSGQCGRRCLQPPKRSPSAYEATLFARELMRRTPDSLGGERKFVGASLPITVWGTTLVTGRQRSNTHVHVATVRQKVDVATLPKSASDEGHALFTALFGDRFVMRDGLLAIALSNLNPQNHLGIALLI